jgi:hypothetical protein
MKLNPGAFFCSMCIDPDVTGLQFDCPRWRRRMIGRKFRVSTTHIRDIFRAWISS